MTFQDLVLLREKRRGFIAATVATMIDAGGHKKPKTRSTFKATSEYVANVSMVMNLVKEQVPDDRLW